MNPPPVFIVGSPRSGTTLLRNMLNRHPRLAICGETQFYRLVYTRCKAFGDPADPENRRRLVNEYLSTDRIRRSGVPIPGLEQRLLRDATSYAGFFAALMEHFAESEGKPRGGEKTPQHALFSETLCEWYPGAAIIHIIRDPREVVASLQLVPWASNSIVTNAKIWLRNNLAARKSSHRPGYLMVRYQDLVSAPERELARICAHVHEDYAPSMLVAERDKVVNSSGRGRAKTPVTTERLGKWRQQSSQRDVALIEWVARRHLKEFGFTSSAAPPSLLTIAWGLGYSAFDAFWRRFLYLPAVFYHFLRPTKIANEEFWVYRRIRKAERLAEQPKRADEVV